MDGFMDVFMDGFMDGFMVSWIHGFMDSLMVSWFHGGWMITGKGCVIMCVRSGRDKDQKRSLPRSKER